MNSVSRGIQSRKYRHVLPFPYRSHSAGLGRAKSGAKSEGGRVQYQYLRIHRKTRGGIELTQPRRGSCKFAQGR